MIASWLAAAARSETSGCESEPQCRQRPDAEDVGERATIDHESARESASVSSTTAQVKSDMTRNFRQRDRRVWVESVAPNRGISWRRPVVADASGEAKSGHLPTRARSSSGRGQRQRRPQPTRTCMRTQHDLGILLGDIGVDQHLIPGLNAVRRAGGTRLLLEC